MLISANPLVTVCLQYLRQRWTACFSTDDRSMFIERLRGKREFKKIQSVSYTVLV